MIIFDLDGVLADCEHRKHFVVKPKKPQCTCDPECYEYHGQMCAWYEYIDWKPDWDAFYEACDKDKPVQPVIDVLNNLRAYEEEIHAYKLDVQIWSGRSELVRVKTQEWRSEER